MSTKKVVLAVLVASAVALALSAGPLGAGTVQALPPTGTTLPYSGRLSDDAGQPVADGAYDFTFALYDAAQGGNLLWSETQTGVAVRGGAFTTRLGSASPLPAALSGEHWLAVGVRGPGEDEFTALTPRQVLAAPSASLNSGGACPHDHFGEWWEGDALYGLGINNTGTGDGLDVATGGTQGVSVYAPSGDGVSVSDAGGNGLAVTSAGTNGVYVDSAPNGVRVYSAGYAGVYVGSAGMDGVYVNSAPNGVRVGSAGTDGVVVLSAGDSGVHVGSATRDGVYVDSAGYNGMWVSSAGYNGVIVSSAGQDGVSVYAAGASPPSPLPSSANNGFEVAAAEGNGLYVGATGSNGVQIWSAGGHGVDVASSGAHGVHVYSASGDGLSVESAGNDGVEIGSAAHDGVEIGSAGNDGVEIWSAAHDGVDVAGTNYAGYFRGSIYVSGGCIGCLQAVFGRNAGDHTLEPGDIVAIQGLQATTLDNAPSLWNVVPAGGGGAVVGVVSGRAELDVAAEGQELRPGETGQRLVPREGAAQPGEYLIIVVSGPMQVRAGPDAAGSIQPGTRLAVRADGLVRVQRMVVVDGVVQSDPVLGIALAAPDQDGLVWVLVNPQ
jgi:hypothetical protein